MAGFQKYGKKNLMITTKNLKKESSFGKIIMAENGIKTDIETFPSEAH
jgi:hypothetical protein